MAGGDGCGGDGNVASRMGWVRGGLLVDAVRGTDLIVDGNLVGSRLWVDAVEEGDEDRLFHEFVDLFDGLVEGGGMGRHVRVRQGHERVAHV